MARVCEITGKGPMSGNNVSHANNKNKRKFKPNLHTKKFWNEEENRWEKLKVSANGMRTIEKKGLKAAKEGAKVAEEKSKKITKGE